MGDPADIGGSPAKAARPGPAISRSRTEKPPSLGYRLRQWRNDLIASAKFRNQMLRFPGTRWLAQRKANALFRLTAGFVFSQILSACVTLGVLDRLRSGPLSTDALAEACHLAPARMRLLLDQAERLGLIRHAGRNAWTLDDAGTVVAADAGLKAMIEHHSLFYRDLVQPAELFGTAERDTELKRYWAYAHHPDPSGIKAETANAYSGLMRSSQAMMADCILAAHDFGRYASILDVGGGDGTFLATAAAAYPDLKLQLFDLPPVTELARQRFAESRLVERIEFHSGDFAKVPVPASADCVCLIRVLCDHDDDRVLTILTNLHRSLKSGTRIMVAEAMAGKTEGARLAAVYFSLYFLAMGSGKCRTDNEIKILLKAAGFRRPHTIATATPLLATLVFATR